MDLVGHDFLTLLDFTPAKKSHIWWTLQPS